MAPDCPTCGMKFERVTGYWLGSMALNLVATEVTFVVALVIMLTATWPDVPWTSVLITLVVANLILPLVFHPFSRTLWMGMERRFSGDWD